MPRHNKIEQFKSKYDIERSAYRIDHDTNIVHLRMLSPNDARHVEYFSYTIQRGLNARTTIIENDVLEKMEANMDAYVFTNNLTIKSNPKRESISPSKEPKRQIKRKV